jgi:hypothetical protein
MPVVLSSLLSRCLTPTEEKVLQYRRSQREKETERNGGLSLSCSVRGTRLGGPTSKAGALSMIDDGQTPPAWGTEFDASRAATRQDVVAGIDLVKLRC